MPRRQQRGVEVDRHHLVPGVEVDVDRAAATAGERGTVDDGVEAAESVNGFLDAPGVVAEEGEVADRDDALATGVLDETEGGLGPLGRDVGDGDPRALRREEHRDRITDAGKVDVGCGAGAGDERPFPAEPVARVAATRPRRVRRVGCRVAHGASLASIAPCLSVRRGSCGRGKMGRRSAAPDQNRGGHRCRCSATRASVSS